MKTLIFDFDSTLIQVETLEVLAEVALEHHPEKNQRLAMIHDLTQQAMEGKMGFEESLQTRFSLLSLTQDHVAHTISILKNKITPSCVRNKRFFKQNKESIFIISSSFIDIVWPIAQLLGFKRENVFANRLLYDYEGRIHGYDTQYPLAQNQGKIKLAQQLLNPSATAHDVTIIGDGYTDYELKHAGIADLFIAFTENVTRASLLPYADAVVDSLEGVFLTLNLPYVDQVPHKRIVLLENIHPDVATFFREQGYEIKNLPHALSDNELIHALEGAQIVGIRSKTTFSADLLGRLPHLEAIGAFCIGTNQIDLKQCNQQGIAVFNAPFSNTRSVVELALAEIIMLVRKAARSARLLGQGQWYKSSQQAYEVRGKVLGIIGYGKIGSQLSIVAEALGMQVIFYDIEDKLPLGNAKACASLDPLLMQADVISVHVDGNEDNRHFIDAPQFEKMKQGVIFLNLSRDFVVNENALLDALHSGKIGGLGLDVFSNEPHASQTTFSTPFQLIENAILTPHIGGSTEEAQQNIGEYVSKNLHLFCTEGATLGSVNFPSLALPTLHSPQRILHLHNNVPGILAQINHLFAQSHCNIEAQFLKTNDSLGYVITDLNHALEKAVIDQLRAIPHTIKLVTLSGALHC